jgi:hypothetical protein
MAKSPSLKVPVLVLLRNIVLIRENIVLLIRENSSRENIVVFREYYEMVGILCQERGCYVGDRGLLL